MLTKKYRLVKNASFSYVYRKGSIYSSKHLNLLVVPSKTSSVKIGFSVSNKVGNAVKRNKVKRRLRSIVACSLPKICRGCQLVFVAKPTIGECVFKELTNIVDLLWKQSKLFELPYEKVL